VLATHLYQMIATGFATDYGKAAAVGHERPRGFRHAHLPLPRADRRERKVRDHLGPRLPPTVVELKAARIPLFLVVAALSFIHGRAAGGGAVLPRRSCLFDVPSARAFSMMSLRHWAAVLTDPLSLAVN